LDAHNLVQAYLGEIESALMYDVWGFRAELFGVQSANINNPQAAFDEQHVIKIQELRKRAKDVLKPHATMTALIK
jgi:hypothetical protein